MSGNAPQRRPSDAPSWWAELERVDLPEGQAGSALTAPSRPSPRGRIEPGIQRPARRTDDQWAGIEAAAAVPPAPSGHALRNVASTLFVVLAAVAVAWFGVGGGSLRSVLVVIVVFGIPAALAAAIVVVAMRRTS